MKTLVYGLVDPRTHLVRYVGKSSAGLKRPLQHAEPNSLKRSSRKSTWIRELLDAGLKYGVAVLEYVNPADERRHCSWWTGVNASALCDAERWWIAYGRASSWPLTNTSDGGVGNPGRKASAETVAKMIASRNTPEALAASSARSTGRRMSPEACEKIAASKRGKLASDATKAKMSASRKGKKFPGRKRRSGVRHSEATCLLMSIQRRGRKMSESSSEKKRTSMSTPEQLQRMRANNPMLRPEVKAKAAATRAATKARKLLG